LFLILIKFLLKSRARMAEDERVKLVSFTGSTEIGQKVNLTVQKRFGK